MLSTTKWLTCMSALGKTGRKRLYHLFKNLLVWLFSSFMPTTINLPLQMPKWANSVALYSRMRWKTVSIHFVPSNLNWEYTVRFGGECRVTWIRKCPLAMMCKLCDQTIFGGSCLFWPVTSQKRQLPPKMLPMRSLHYKLQNCRRLRAFTIT